MDEKNIYNDEEYYNINHQRHNLSLNQKISLGILVFFGISIFVYSLFNMNNRLSLKKDSSDSGVKENSYLAEDTSEALKTKDTDTDGLSDWDELNLYKTSPYIEDSDSDGYSDSAEIEKGTNPNCPQGADCDNFSQESINKEFEESSNNVEVDNSVLGVADLTTDKTTSTSSVQSKTNVNKTISSDDDSLNKIISGNAEADELREALIEFGMDKSILDKFSDEELIKSYKSSLK